MVYTLRMGKSERFNRQFAFGLQKMLWITLPRPAIGMNSDEPPCCTATDLAVSRPSDAIRSLERANPGSRKHRATSAGIGVVRCTTSMLSARELGVAARTST